jgi:hypothetical protein
VERYRGFLTLFGVREGDVPPEYSPRSVLLYSVRAVLTLLALALPAFIGVVAWWSPYAAPRIVTSTVRPELDAIATYRLGTALITFPAAWMVWIGVGLRWGGIGWALLMAAGLPLAGLASLAFLERWRRVAEDLMVFARALPSGRGRDRLSTLRADLVARFDAVAQQLGMTSGG